MTRKRNQIKNKQWSSAAARRLLDMAGNPPTIDEAVRIVVRKVLNGISCPPTNLEAVAEKLGVNEILSEDLPVSGELRRDGKKLKIIYSTYLSPGRKQFTIAHELGHAIFESTGARPPRAGEELERICDKLASEMLMPQDIFLSMTDREPSISNLLQMSQTFSASLHATSIRYSKLKEVPVFCLENENVNWKCGFNNTKSLSLFDANLKIAVKNALNGELNDDIVLLRNREQYIQWKLDFKLLNYGKRALFMLSPYLQNNQISYRHP